MLESFAFETIEIP